MKRGRNILGSGNVQLDQNLSAFGPIPRVMTMQVEVITGKSGTYILRGLPVGRIEVRARTPLGTESQPLTIDLPAGPVTRRSVNLAVKKR